MPHPPKGGSPERLTLRPAGSAAVMTGGGRWVEAVVVVVGGDG